MSPSPTTLTDQGVNDVKRNSTKNTDTERSPQKRAQYTLENWSHPNPTPSIASEILIQYKFRRIKTCLCTMNVHTGVAINTFIKTSFHATPIGNRLETLWPLRSVRLIRKGGA